MSTTVALPANAQVGTTVTGTVTFTNTTATPTTLTATITINGSPTLVSVFVAANSSANVTVSVPVTTAGASVTANVGTTSVPETITTDNSASAALIALIPDLTVVLNLPATGIPGTTVSATVTFSNIGTGTASAVVGTTSLSTGQVVTATLGSLPAGGITTTVIQVFIPITATGTISGTSTVATSTPETTLTNNTSSASLVVNQTDVSTTVALPATGVPGTTVSATVTFSNATSVATTITATITINGVATLTSVFVAANTTVTQVVSVPVTTSGATVTSNIGTSSVPETTTANNVATATLVASLTDVSTTVALPATGVPGTTVSATVTFSNATSVATTITATITINGVATLTSVFVAANSTVTQVVSVPVTTSGATVTSNIGTSSVPETTTANNVATATLVAGTPNASVSGRVWLDINGDKKYQPGLDKDLSGWKVELLQGRTIVGSAITSSTGSYVITGQVPGSGYSVRFKNPAGQILVSTPENQTSTTEGGKASTGTTTSVFTGGGVISGAISNVTLYSGDNTIEQNLPIDPSGVVYDAITRDPVAGAIVTLIGPNGAPVLGTDLLQGSPSMTTDGSGLYQFDLLPSAPSGRYKLQVTPPAQYLPTPAIQGGVSAPGVAPNTTIGTVNGVAYKPPTGPGNFILMQPNTTAPAVAVNVAGAVSAIGTQYFLEFDFDPTSKGVKHNHIPLDPLTSDSIRVTKVGDKTVAEVADSVRYTIRLRNTTAILIANVKLEDLLPAGFRYILGTARLNSVTIADPAGGVGRALTFNIGTLAGNNAPPVELSYYVRLGVGSQQGDGINRATAIFGNGIRSKTAQFKVNVQGGVFSNDGCVIGKVYVDCDGSHVQNNESGSRELGIPGVRLVMLDGTYVITDNEGKYSMCGLKPQTHVVKVDRSTLPKGSRLLPSSNRNAGVGDSIFVDLKGGELARADFIEGSCSPEVLDQVKARRAQGGVLAPEKEIAPDLKIDNRPSEAQQQILPAPRPSEPVSPPNAPAGGTRP